MNRRDRRILREEFRRDFIARKARALLKANEAPFVWPTFEKLHGTVRSTLGLPTSEPAPQLWTTDTVAASANGFVSLRRLRDGGPSQLRRVPRNWHQEQLEPGDEALLLPQEVIARALRKFQNAPELRGDRRVPLRALGRYAGVSHGVVYKAASGRRISNKSRLRLSMALRDIMAGKLTFRRCGRGVRFEPVRSA